MSWVTYPKTLEMKAAWTDSNVIEFMSLYDNVEIILTSVLVFLQFVVIYRQQNNFKWEVMKTGYIFQVKQ